MVYTMITQYVKGSKAIGKTAAKESAHQFITGDIQFRKLIENSSFGVTLLNKDLQPIYRSPSAQRITGWNTDDRVTKTLGDLTHPADREMVIKLLNEVLISPNVPKTCSFRSIHFKNHYI